MEQKTMEQRIIGTAFEKEEFRVLMEELRKSNAGQEKYARKQYRMSQITAAASVLVLAVVCYTCAVFIPKVNVTYENMQLIMEDMKTITSELASADLEKMISDVDHLVYSSEENINTALKKINEIDIESLNQAIRNLSDVVEPFAAFMSRF